MTTTDASNVGAILLAGGASRGLGHPKQLVVHKGRTLIRLAAERLAASECDPVIVVLGAVVDQCRQELEDLPVTVCVNADWDVGISSSIRAGLRCLIDQTSEPAGVLISLCDQPYVTTEDYNALVDEFTHTGAPITAASYNNLAGVPAVFARELFPELLRLQGDEGARHLVRHNLFRTSTVDITGAGFDVDTPVDLASLE